MKFLKKLDSYLFGKEIFKVQEIELPPIRLGTLDNYDDIKEENKCRYSK
jgi:hypothetical protein